MHLTKRPKKNPNKNPELILSIESSCDDSSIAITDICSKKILFHKKVSQESAHACYGGVVPELASRLHAQILPSILEQTKSFFPSIKAVCVTNKPGLSLSLLEGVMMAKTLAFCLGVPLIGVNHLKGHVYSLFLEKPAQFPLGVLLVSGGHTLFLDVQGYNQMPILAQSMDDSFGESFDKVAKMLGLSYPGGPIVEQYAKSGDAWAFDFPLPLKSKSQLAFSFSGLKNAVRMAIEQQKKSTKPKASNHQSPNQSQKKSHAANLSEQFRADICASFQRVAISHLRNKCELIFKAHGHRWKSFALVGGASANLSLRAEFAKLCKDYSYSLALTPLQYCADNAAMIGRVGLEAYALGEFDLIEDLDIETRVRAI